MTEKTNFLKVFSQSARIALQRRGIYSWELLEMLLEKQLASFKMTLPEIKRKMGDRNKRFRLPGESIATRAAELFDSVDNLPLAFMLLLHPDYARNHPNRFPASWDAAGWKTVGQALNRANARSGWTLQDQAKLRRDLEK